MIEHYRGSITEDNKPLATEYNKLVDICNRFLAILNTKEINGKKVITDEEKEKIEKDKD